MTGVAGHAGGTPYERRHDALIGASELVVEVESVARASGVIGTVGRMQAFPGGVNVIPGRVEFSLDLRAPTDHERDRVLAEITRRANVIAERRGLRFESTEIYRADATACAPWLQDAIASGIRHATGEEPLAMWSRAGHDGMAVSAVADVAMLFVRCGRGGISHSPDEIVDVRDVAIALDAFEATIIEIAERVRAEPGRLGSDRLGAA